MSDTMESNRLVLHRMNAPGPGPEFETVELTDGVPTDYRASGGGEVMVFMNVDSQSPLSRVGGELGRVLSDRPFDLSGLIKLGFLPEPTAQDLAD